MGQAENCGGLNTSMTASGVRGGNRAWRASGMQSAAIRSSTVPELQGTVVRCADARSSVWIRCARNPARGEDNADHAASGEEEVGLKSKLCYPKILDVVMKSQTPELTPGRTVPDSAASFAPGHGGVQGP